MKKRLCSLGAIALAAGTMFCSTAANAQPANNACGANQASFTIPGGGGVVTGSMTGATRDGAACAGTTGIDVYWYWTPNSAGPWQLDTCTAGSFDSVLSIHNNTCPVSASTYANGLGGAVACNDDTSGCGTGASSKITVTLTAGTTYIIRMASFSSGSTGTYTLTVSNVSTPGACCLAGACSLQTVSACTSPSSFLGTGTVCSPNPCPQPPANDLCANATIFTGTGFTTTGNNNLATTDGWANDPAGTFGCAPGNTQAAPNSRADMWYKFTPSVTNVFNLALCASVPSWDSVLSVHTACPDTVGGTNSNTLACNDDGTCAAGVGLSAITGLNLNAGVPVWIRVARYGATGTQNDNFTLQVTSSPLGSCCATDGTCALTTQAACTTAGGSYQGDNTTCATAVCTGACCNPTTGACTATGPANCVSPNVFQTVGSVCSPNPCPQPPPPANDVCSGAFTANVGTTTGDNTTATTDSAASCQASSNKDVWYSFTAPSAGGYVIDTEGSAQGDTVLSVFDVCGGTELACDDDSGTGLLSSLLINLTAGQNVKIRVASFGATPTGGGFNLNITSAVIGACCVTSSGACTLSSTGATGCAAGATYLGDNSVCNTTTCPVPPPPANDECTAAVALTVGVAGSGTVTNATGTDITNCSGSDIDVWFSITPAAGAYNILTTPTTAGDDATAIAVFDSCPAVALAEIACVAQPGPGGTNTVGFTAAGGTTYYIRAGAFTGDVGTFSIIVTPTTSGACCNAGTGACALSTTGATGCASGSTYLGDNTVCNTTTCPVPPPPANDSCSTAIALTLNVAASGNNATATSDDGPAASCQTSSGKGVWYTFTPSVSDVYGFTTCGSNQDTVLTVFTITDCSNTGTYTEVACDDDSCDGVTPPGSGLASIIAPTALTAGTTYYVRVSSFGAAPAGGAFTVQVTGTAPTTGRCCVGARCSIVDPSSCVSGGGTAGTAFTAGASDCNASNVFNAPCCFANYNKVGGITVQDIFDFLTDWFSNNVNANVAGNGTAAPSVQDIFDFLAAWFSGGCS